LEATRITRHSLSLVYLNAPYDDEFGGGGREEVTFLRPAIDLLVPAGVLVMICPVNQVFGACVPAAITCCWASKGLRVTSLKSGSRSWPGTCKGASNSVAFLTWKREYAAGQSNASATDPTSLRISATDAISDSQPLNKP
jgi:hypothetical protein